MILQLYNIWILDIFLYLVPTSDSAPSSPCLSSLIQRLSCIASPVPTSDSSLPNFFLLALIQHWVPTLIQLSPGPSCHRWLSSVWLFFLSPVSTSSSALSKSLSKTSSLLQCRPLIQLSRAPSFPALIQLCLDIFSVFRVHHWFISHSLPFAADSASLPWYCSCLPCPPLTQLSTNPSRVFFDTAESVTFLASLTYFSAETLRMFCKPWTVARLRGYRLFVAKL
jgi:hypothetical protein